MLSHGGKIGKTFREWLTFQKQYTKVCCMKLLHYVECIPVYLYVVILAFNTSYDTKCYHSILL